MAMVFDPKIKCQEKKKGGGGGYIQRVPLSAFAFL